MKFFCAGTLPVLFALACVAGIVADGVFVEPRRLETVRASAKFDSWPAEAGAARIVLLADLHPNDREGEWMDRVVRETLSLKPEAVVMLGDYHNALNKKYSMDDAELARRLAPLARACPVYYVCGNHDYFEKGRAVRAEFNKAGFQNIEGQTVSLSFANGCRAYLRGAPYMEECSPPGGQAMRFSKKELPPDAPLIAATHTPYHFIKYELHADMAVAGHTHGGQVCWPGGVPITGRGVIDRDMMRGGWHATATGKPLYVTRGIGMSTLPIRLFCRPEITLLELRGSGKPFSPERRGGEAGDAVGLAPVEPTQEPIGVSK